MSNIRAVVDLAVIPREWSLDQFNKVIEETGLIVVDTEYYGKEGLGVQVVDEANLEILTVEEYDKRRKKNEK